MRSVLLAFDCPKTINEHQLKLEGVAVCMPMCWAPLNGRSLESAGSSIGTGEDAHQCELSWLAITSP